MCVRSKRRQVENADDVKLSSGFVGDICFAKGFKEYLFNVASTKGYKLPK